MSSRGGSWRATVVSAAALVALGAGLVVLVQPWADDDESVGVTTDVRASAIIEQLAELSGPPPADGFADLAGSTPEARAWAEQIWSNLDALAADTVTFTYVRSVGARDDGTSQIDVMVEWSSGSAGLDARFPPVTVGLLLRADGERYAIEGMTPVADPVPVWLLGDLEVTTDGSTTLLTLDGGPQVTALAGRALGAGGHVRDRLDVADPALVVVAPRDSEQAAQLLGREAGELEPIAALTTRLGGASPGAEVSGVTAVVLNAPVFAGMDDRGADIVLAHEAVHAMTDSIGRGLEAWAVEGFADYIALVDDERPVTEIAAQYLDRVAAGDTPQVLPSTDDFAAADHLGSVYEAAWLVVHYLAAEYGHVAVIDFYDALLAGEPLDDALREAFGISVDGLEAAWIDYVTDLAGD